MPKTLNRLCIGTLLHVTFVKQIINHNHSNEKYLLHNGDVHSLPLNCIQMGVKFCRYPSFCTNDFMPISLLHPYLMFVPCPINCCLIPQ